MGEKFPRCRRAGFKPLLAKFLSGPMTQGWEPSVRAVDVEAYLEARLKAATDLMDQATRILEAGDPLPPELIRRARELFEK